MNTDAIKTKSQEVTAKIKELEASIQDLLALDRTFDSLCSLAKDDLQARADALKMLERTASAFWLSLSYLSGDHAKALGYREWCEKNKQPMKLSPRALLRLRLNESLSRSSKALKKEGK